MARKKTPIDETPQDVPAETTEDTQEIDYQKDIQGKDMVEVALDTPAVEEETVEETLEEKPAEEEFETVEFDPEQLKKEAKEEALKEMAEMAEKSKAPEEPVDEYQTFVDDYTKKNGKAPDWKEVAVFLKEKAKEEIKADFEAEKTAEQAKAEEARKAEETQTESVNKFIDDQFNQLYSTEKFPRMKNPEDPNDLGVQYRRALADQTMQINRERLDKGLPTKTLMEVFFTEFKAPNAQPAGADAPISAGKSGGTSEDAEEINYIRDVKRPRSFRDILMRRG